jgi:hypothetical protein
MERKTESVTTDKNTHRFIDKYDRKLKPIKRNDSQYEEDRQAVIKSRAPATQPAPTDPTKRSYVFMLTLGQWQIIHEGQSVSGYYPNRKEAIAALRALEAGQADYEPPAVG